MIQVLAGICGSEQTPDQLCRDMLASFPPSSVRLVVAEKLHGKRFAILGSAARGRSTPAEPGAANISSGPCLLMADSRLDNRGELLQELQLPPATDDEELLQQAWLRWGPAMVHHLLGGFAIACWDARQQTLFLARDHSGERPLHFARPSTSDVAFAFASLPLALCSLPWVGRTIDVARVALMLAPLDFGNPQTCFRGVERLLPGHWLKLTPAGMEIRRYWHPSEAPEIRYRRDDDYIEDFRERLDRAVGVRLAGETPIASELSGGLDSSSVTVTAARLLAAEGKRLTAFTAVPVAGYDGRALPGNFGDEGPFAAEAAALHPNIEHILVDAAGLDLIAACSRIFRLSGELTLNPMNQVWLNAILDQVSDRGLGVLLQGEAGNSTISFDGLAGLGDLFRRGRWLRLVRQTRELRARGHVSWRNAAGWATSPFVPLSLRRIFQPGVREFSFDFSPVHPDRITEYDLRNRTLEAFYGGDGSSEAVRRQTYEFFDPGSHNAVVTSHWGIEQRDPTQDKRIYEFCFGIPIEQYLVGGQARSLIRRAMQGRLPEATLRRTNRGMQAADWYLLMGAQRGRLAAELRRVERSPLVRHLIDTPRLHALLESWPETGHEQPHVHAQWHLALSRGITAGSFLAEHDPEMPREVEPVLSAAETKRPGA